VFLGSDKKIRVIADALERMRKGDLDQRVFLGSGGALAGIGSALNNAAASLKETILALARENRRIQATLDNMVEGVIALDHHARIISLNSPIEKIFSLSKKEAAGKNFLEAIRNVELLAIIENVLGQGKFISQELSIVLPVQKVFQINASPVFENGKVSGCVVVVHDISEIRALEIIRRDFVTNVSHELKTPLTSIKGFIETLLEGAMDDKEHNRQFLEIIRDHTNRLDQLTNDLLQLSSLELKGMQLEKSVFALRPLCERVLLGFTTQLKIKGVLVKTDIPAALRLEADQDKLEQVVTNLIDNAIKFSKEKGLIEISALEADAGIKVIIADSGIGIPLKDIPRIFERFYRVDKARARELGGTGLGLSIVKHIVELHGGRIGVESNEGFGSRFWFTIPR
jgi:two-component system phosphate regulon sensor histidine kinase PhoR